MKISLPQLALVALIGTSGSGKSTFAKKYFAASEVLSSDFCRGLVSDDENSQDATNDAFDVLYYIAAKRLARGKLTVIDATNVQAAARKSIVNLARAHDVLPIALVLNTSEKVCQERNKTRQDRNFGEHVIRNQSKDLKKSLKYLEREGFRHVFIVEEGDFASVEIERQKLWNDLTQEEGPFDIIGDVHGCFDELAALLKKLGYQILRDDNAEQVEDYLASKTYTVVNPLGRRAIFLGDLCDRGPKTPEVYKLVMSMVAAGNAFCVPGNHDTKLVKKLRGRDVKLTHGLPETLEQLSAEREEFKRQLVAFIDRLVSHYVMDGGNLVVAHAGMKEQYQGRTSARVRDFALYGETTGETDEYGLPVRYNWAADYRGKAHVIYGHVPVSQTEWTNKTICLDTGCVFGGKLTALRYPEKEIVEIPAARVYYEPLKPLGQPAYAAPRAAVNVANTTEDIATNTSFAISATDDMLRIEDVSGKRVIATSLMNNVIIREENSIAALEVMSRFAVQPNWLAYLPPTMSPSETSKQEGYLEHPVEAFEFFRRAGIEQVVCEEKHMGSRAVVVICLDDSIAQRRFGVHEKSLGIVYTRTGRPFFNDKDLEQQFLQRLLTACQKAEVFERFETDWAILDCELMPWSLKAQDLLRDQYAAVGTAASIALKAARQALQRGEARGLPLASEVERFADRISMTTQFTEAYRKYCWSVVGIEDLRLAPFHLLATEGTVHADKNHLWHLEELAKLVQPDEPIIIATRHKVINTSSAESVIEGTNWWLELTGGGGEGMVVKPLNFINRGEKSLLQPAIKVRGREYLRIIYGAEYSAPENLDRLRSRSLGGKRALALREFALGIEALERFVRREPLYRVHECVFGVLAMESEAIDPRL